MKRLVALLVPFLLVATACGPGDDDDDQADTVPEGQVGAEPDDTATPPGDDADIPSPEPDPVELTDSFRGVTGTTITIGVGAVDGSSFGFDAGDREAKFASAVAHVNATGGIAGRELEMLFESYGPLGAVEAEAACIKHTENEMVFAFVGSMRQGNILCYTELHDTIAVNALAITDEELERSTVLLLSTGPDDRGQLLNGIESLGAEELFVGRRVAISYDDGAGDDLDRLRDLLVDFGAEVVSETRLMIENEDTVKADRDMDTAVQRWITDGATTVVAIGDNVDAATIGGVGRAGADIDVVALLTDVGQIERLGHDPATVPGTIYGFSPPTNLELYEADLHGVRECVERFEAFSGETVILDPGPEDLTNFTLTVNACRAIELFAAVAVAVGADLTNDSFATAAAGLNAIELTGTAGASLGPDKFRALDTVPDVLVYDSEENIYVRR